MSTHLKLGMVLVVLLAAAAVVIYTQAPKPDSFAPAEHVHDASCGHLDAEGNLIHEEASTEAQTGEASVTPPAPQAEGDFSPVIPPATGPRTKVRIETSMGDIDVILFDDLTPRTVKNFLDLANKGFYKDMIFHRVIQGFVIQTGDPVGNGTGGPGYKFDDEIVPQLRHDQPGVVAMANAGPGTGTNGSQFYITMRPVAQLDGGYSIFGQVVAGMDVVQAINEVRVSRSDRPINNVAFKGVVVLGQE